MDSAGTNYEVVRDEGAVIVVAKANQGRLTSQGFGSVCHQLEDELRQCGKVTIIFDCFNRNGLGYADLGLLLKLWRLTNRYGGRFVLCHVSPVAMDDLRLVNLFNLWPIYSSRAEAAQTVRDQGAQAEKAPMKRQRGSRPQFVK